MDNNAKNSEVIEFHPRGGYGARRRNLRPVIFVVAILLVAGIVFFIIALNNKKNPDETSNGNSTPTKTQEPSSTKPAETQEKKLPETSESASNNPEVIDGKTPKNTEGEDANTYNDLTGVINYAESDGETLMIRVSIDQYLDGGTCLLELNAPASNDTFSLTDQIAPSASTSSCGFDIATELLIPGKYDIKITLESAGKKGTITGEVNV